MTDTCELPSTLGLPQTYKLENGHGVSQAESSFLHRVTQGIVADQHANSVKSNLQENPQENPSSSERERQYRFDI